MFSEEDYKKAVAIVRRDDRASASYIQRTFQIGYNTAAAMMQRMEREGVVTAPNHMGKREVLKPCAAELKQTMLLAMSEHHSGNAEEAGRIVDAQLAALEAAGVRMVNLNALAQDDAAVARIKAALLSMPRTYELVPEDQWATEYARVAIRAMGGG